VYSKRRTRSAAARWRGDTVVVTLPEGVSAKEEARLVKALVARLGGSRDDLTTRALALNDAHLGGRAVPREVKWVTNQNSRWGSCTPSSGVIRVSHRLQKVPGWVLDAVLLHELAHLLEPNHSKAFDALLDQDLVKRADLFLEGYALGLSSSA
jgi:predicted metal-dependent hydrolase